MKLLPILLLILLQNCSTPIEDGRDITRMLINSHKVECQGVILQQCYLVKEGRAIENDTWSYFYEEIKGFEYVQGFIYEIEVEKTERNPIPQDAGKYQYTFVRLINKTAVN